MASLKRLKAGDSIGIFSPSAPVTYTCPKRFHRGKSLLENKGFKVVEKEVFHF